MRFPETVLVTGSSGLLGSAIVEALDKAYNVVGFDKAGPPYPPIEAECVSVDLTKDESVARGLERVEYAYGRRLAAVIHLAAYYDFSGEDSPLYQSLTIEGTRRLLRMLKRFHVGVFAFASTMLVHKPCRPGERIDENWPLEAKWQYPQSKIDAERVIADESRVCPSAALRIAGVYDDLCHSIPLAHQIRRIDAERLTSKFFPGDTSRGQSFVHLDDVIDAFRLLIERRSTLSGFTPILIGEEETLSYDEIQRTTSRLIHGEEIETTEIPKPIAEAGAWIQDANPFGEDPFIKPWMISMADDHYALDTSRARLTLGWSPKRSLRRTLPVMVSALLGDPARWYKENQLEPPDGSKAMDRAGSKAAGASARAFGADA
jgi:nucleoside-diphosphate-sugar epimerase